MLGSNTGPLSIGFWSGESDGPAVWAEGRVCWLADLGGLEFLDSVFEKRGMSDKPFADVHMMDPAAGEHRVVRLRLPSRGTKISFHAGLLIITVSNGVVAYAVDDLWTAALPVRNVPLSAVSTEWNSVPVSGAIVGALLHGPTGDDWGYEYVDDFLHKVLDPVFDKLVESDLQVRSEFEEPFWKANPSQRLRLIDGLTNNLLKWVFEAWPDSDALLAAKTFRHSAGDTRTITAVQATPFGGLPQNPGLAESMSKRLHDLPFGDFAPEAIGTSRFLLYEHIRRCINEVPFNVALDGWLWEEKADRQIRARVSPELARTLSWCDLDLLDPRSARAMLVHFIECWPRGRPPWKGAVQEYLQFLADCMHYGLVCRLKPNTLSAALARMWRDPRHPSRHDAFISYSRRDEEIANVVAEGLSKRGLRVGLDRWEIEPDLDQRSVEMWMAESVMSSVARVLLVSDHALRSGWVTREIDWDFQLLGAKRAAALPFVVSIDAAASRMMEHYPGSRLISGAVLEDGARRSGVLEELALRIGIDCLAMFVDGSDGCIFGLEGFVGAPEVEVRWTT
jgi:hypothetical protein